ncbi:hypothetical protein C474_07087 [Halogeometricum pallidum JCM 14848]|uniref:DUF2270 domain-containing protein n=2 Tax=Halogeometricum TaxID=60846 RepID=M0DAR0_HALPD|nr:hypothetical protein C474_07087 [Halogeometricum pallidum JCM 14848]
MSDSTSNTAEEEHSGPARDGYDCDESFDAVSEEARTMGRGFFEESSAPGSAMAHLYRGEIHRMTLWRERLDRTSNWAVTLIAAILTYAFSSANRPHYVILVGVVMVAVFLVIEARRYRGYDMWRSRVRILQRNVFAYSLDPSQGIEDPDWRPRLSRDYREPRVKISYEEAIAHRLRRVYLPLFTVLLGAWLFRVLVTADAGSTWPVSASVGAVSGTVATGLVGVFYAVLVGITFRPRVWQATGELRRNDIGAWDDIE